MLSGFATAGRDGGDGRGEASMADFSGGRSVLVPSENWNRRVWIRDLEDIFKREIGKGN